VLSAAEVLDDRVAADQLAWITQLAHNATLAALDELE
jgi:hypothetical protein